MDKETKFPATMNDVGEPQEMSPASGSESKTPFVEVEQPVQSQDPLEIRTPSSVTVI